MTDPTECFDDIDGDGAAHPSHPEALGHHPGSVA